VLIGFLAVGWFVIGCSMFETGYVTVGVVRPEVICMGMMVYVSFVVGILIQIQLVIVVLVGVAGTADVVIVWSNDIFTIAFFW
jgi:hypothetical protein